MHCSQVIIVGLMKLRILSDINMMIMTMNDRMNIFCITGLKRIAVLVKIHLSLKYKIYNMETLCKP